MRVSRRSRTHQFFALATSLLVLVFVEELSAQHRTEAEHGSDHTFHKNHAAPFLGASTITDGDEGGDANVCLRPRGRWEMRRGTTSDLGLTKRDGYK